jgi:predicted RNA-binding protein Jag
MNSYERHLVHSLVKETPGLSSRSVGDGNQKRIEIGKAEG